MHWQLATLAFAMNGNTHDTIQSLAKAEACRIRKFRDQAEEGEDRADLGLPVVPLIHIEARPGRRWWVGSSGSEGHANEPRMAFVTGWLGQVLEQDKTDAGGDPSGTYRLELHDSCSYLPRAEEYRDVLSFCRSTQQSPSRVATIPDPYQAAGYGHKDGQGALRDTVLWQLKRPTVVFAGSSTGDRDPARNARILACMWALNHPLETDFRISAVVQMRPYDIIERWPMIRAVLAPHLLPEAQFCHKFIMNIVGNTACWSRVPMILGSRSVMFHLPHDDAAWYYPEMKAGEHYIECNSLEQILHNQNSHKSDDVTCNRITLAANRFHAQYLTCQAAAIYALHLIQAIPGK